MRRNELKPAIRALASGCLLLLAAGVRAGPFDSRPVPDDAKWVLHVDAERVDLRVLLNWLRRADSAPAGAERPSGREVRLIKILEDIQRKREALPAEITSVTLFGMDASERTAVVYVEGTFDPAALVSAYLSQAKVVDTPVGQIHTLARAEGAAPYLYIAFPASGWLFVARTEAAMKGALARLAASKDGQAPELSVLKQTCLPSDRALVFGAADLAGLEKIAPAASTLQLARTAFWEVTAAIPTLVGTVQLRAENVQTAENLRKMVEGLVAFGLLSAQEQPALGRLAGGIAVKQDDTLISVTFKVAVEDIRAAVIVKHRKRPVPPTAP